MVEGARLESVYRGNSIQGSNPCLSAILETIPAVIGRAGSPKASRWEVTPDLGSERGLVDLAKHSNASSGPAFITDRTPWTSCSRTPRAETPEFLSQRFLGRLPNRSAIIEVSEP